MKKEAIIGIGIIIIAVLLLGIMFWKEIDQEESIEDNDVGEKSNIGGKVKSQGLGSLCPDEENCKNYCLNNRGQCEQYCQENTSELCKIIFPSNSPSDEPEKNENDKGTPTVINARECENNSNPSFTFPFTDNSKIREISPIGHAFINNPGSSARSYVTVNPGIKEGSRNLVPIYAPVDSTLVQIAYVNRNYGDRGTRPEYSLTFQASCEVKYTFDHISSAVDEIKKIAPTDPSSRNDIYISMPVKAGQLIGHTDGTYTAGGFDFMVLNTANEENYVNPSRWILDHSKYGVCPYDYFIPELKEKYYSLLQKTRSKDAQASCRTVSRDVPGTLSGGWFQGDATESKGSRLVIATISIDMIDLVMMRDDEATSFRDSSNPDITKPEEVTIGKSVCYHDRDKNKYAYLKLLSEKEMGLVIGNGTCPSGFPSKYEVWNR